jgi:FkbM family methyltransferase
MLTILWISYDSQKNTKGEASIQKQRLVFIDFGANMGDSFKVFLQEPTQKFAFNFSKPADRRYDEFEFHLFEANPFFNEKLLKVKEDYTKRGLNVNIYPSTVVYTHDTLVPFFLDKVNHDHDYWGSSILSHHPDVLRGDKIPVNLTGIDAANFLLKNFLPSDFVVVKMDIEGAEYSIIPHIASMKAHLVIDYFYVEFHGGLLPEDNELVKATNEAMKIFRKDGVECPNYGSPAK